MYKKQIKKNLNLRSVSHICAEHYGQERFRFYSY